MRILLKRVALATALLPMGVAMLQAQTPTAGEEVDLGLSVNWRGYNLGAHSPQEVGEKFSFASLGAATSQYYYEFYDSSTRKYSYPLTVFSGNPEYDAAAANTDGDWRLGTYEEWKELIDNCSIQSLNYEGVEGVLLTSTINGNSIFLPVYNNTIRYYTSKALSSTMVLMAEFKTDGSGASTLTNTTPYVALPLRPVCPRYTGPALESINITCEATEIFAGTVTTVSASLVPEEVPSRIVWSSSDDQVASVSSTGIVSGISSGIATITATQGDVSASVDITVTAVETDMSADVVDLGLSVDWCTRNLGAESVTEKGDSYPFAYITPTIIQFSQNYKYKNGFPFDLFMDGDPEYDAVAYTYGADSRMRLPSNIEMDELIENCHPTLVTVDGVTCLRLTSKINGRYIIFSLDDVYYWSGSPAAEGSKAYAIFFKETSQYNPETCQTNGYMSHPLRGVQEHEEIPELEDIELNLTEAEIYEENTVKLGIVSYNPAGARLDGLVWESDDENVAQVSDAGLVTGTGAGTALITARVGEISASATITVKAVDLAQGETVDMGTSVLWSTIELDAPSQSENGPRYYWGETTPRTDLTEDFNLWTDPGVDEICGTQYDVAHTRLEGAWRMPSQEDVIELSQAVTTEWITYGGSYGALLTSTITGQRIFCPMPQYATATRAVSYFCGTIKRDTSSGEPYGYCISIYDGMSARDDLQPVYIPLPVRPVKVRLESISVTPDELSIIETATVQLSVTPQPAEADIDGLVWTSDNEAVATVSDEGLVTGVSEGTAVITAAVGEISATTTVTVTSQSGLTDQAVLTDTFAVYNVDGVAVFASGATVSSLKALHPGIYVLKYADGTARKYIKR